MRSLPRSLFALHLHQPHEPRSKSSAPAWVDPVPALYFRGVLGEAEFGAHVDDHGAGVEPACA